MTNLQVYKKINRKCKLYIAAPIYASTLTGTVSFFAGLGVADIVPCFISSPLLQEYQLGTFIFSTFGTVGCFLPLTLSAVELWNRKLTLCRQIKEDLNNGINRFENIDKKDFQKALGEYPLPKAEQ